MMDDAVQMRAPGASTTPPPRPPRSPATPPPGGGSVHQATQVVTLDSASPVPSGPAPAVPVGEPRYTLAEARRILNDSCAGRGHELKQVYAAGRPTELVYCARCPATFGPPNLPPLPPQHELRQDIFRSSGPGAVRLTHIPTGLVAVGDNGGSESENVGGAQLLLRARLLVVQLERESGSEHDRGKRTRPAPPDPDWLHPTPGGL